MAGPSSDSSWGFTRRPTKLGQRVAYDLVRVKPNAGFTGIILSHDSLGQLTHYWGGRTSPCLEDDCKPCTAGNQSRWYCWQAAWDLHARKIVILEIPYIASTELYNFFNEHRTLRGYTVDLRRRNGRANSTLVYKWGKDRCDTENLPKAPDVEVVMRNIWKIGPEVRLKQCGPQLHMPDEGDGQQTA